MAESRWDLREIEVVVSKIKPLKLNKAEKTAVRDHRTIKTTITNVKANHMTSVIVALNSIPGEQSLFIPSSFQDAILG